MKYTNFIIFFLIKCTLLASFSSLKTREKVISAALYDREALNACNKDNFWTRPYDSYLFAPGILCSEYLIGKYCPYYLASTGQIVIGNQEFHVVNGYTAHSCNFAEIVLAEETKIEFAEKSYFPKALFDQSFYTIANFILLKRTLEPYHIELRGESKTGFTLKPYFIDPYKVNFGQNLDIEILSGQYDLCCQSNEPNSMVLYGNSRGAATVFNFMATEYQKKADKRIRAIVLEGCFDAVRYVTWLNPFLSLLPHYEPMGISPIDEPIIKKFVEVCMLNSISVLCVTSRIDRIVPYENTKKLCMKLIEAGLKNFYLVVLQHSGHTGYMIDDKNDIQRYKRSVHAFYQKCGCSHNAALAAEGSQELERSQLS